MTTAYEAIGIPLYVNPGYVEMKRFRSNTAISIVNQGVEQQPTATFEVGSRLDLGHAAALDWLALSKAALPNAQPLAPEERASINEFFWSHFK
jgi:hypothetical protein